ncbi:MAG: hypothetical protein PHF33_00835 [Candidatus Delongbacteria bacterium]|jgi:hypothetical protein|nr:hypothetical protein [Candidatus Delongbacteria bacterium]MDD4204456.1 hypothetical protein [Candidatus Delongbacteria bacterium]
MKTAKKKYVILNLKKNDGLKIKGGVDDGTPGTITPACDTVMSKPKPVWN